MKLVRARASTKNNTNPQGIKIITLRSINTRMVVFLHQAIIIKAAILMMVHIRHHILTPKRLKATTISSRSAMNSIELVASTWTTLILPKKEAIPNSQWSLNARMLTIVVLEKSRRKFKKSKSSSTSPTTKPKQPQGELHLTVLRTYQPRSATTNTRV